MTLATGGRYSWEEKDFANLLTVYTVEDATLPFPLGPFPANTFIPGGSAFVTPPQTRANDNFEDFTPRVVLSYQLSKDVMVYSSYSEGFKSGGFNSFGLSPVAYKNEGLDAFEVGIKSDLLDRTLRLNASLFSYDYANLQIRKRYFLISRLIQFFVKSF